jgi:outer membrane protein TolC
MRRPLALLVVLALARPGPAGAQARPTRTLEECVEIALTRHPRVASADADVEAGRQRVRQERAGYLPQVTAVASRERRKRSAAQATGLPEQQRVETTSQRFGYTTSGVSLTQVLFDFGRNLDAIQAARARRESLEADAAAERDAVVRDVKQGYFDLLATRRLREVAEEVLRSNQRQLEQARGRYEVGFAAKLDLTRSEVLVANAELDALTARNNVLVAEQALRNAMGLREPLDFDPADVLETPPLAISEERALGIAQAKRPELRAVRAARRAAEEDASSRWKEHLPDFSAGVAYDWSGSGSPLQESYQIGAFVTIPIFSGGLIDARVGEARAAALALAFDEEALALDVALEVRSAVLELERARQSIGVAERAQRQARENLELAEGRYRTGAGNVIELADAQAQRASGEAEYVRSLYAYRIAVAELERAVGQELVRP